MKAKKFALIAIAFVILGIGLWLFMRPTVSNPKEITQVSTPTKADAPKRVLSPAQVELPKAPAVPASSSTVPSNPAPDPSDPQADLKTTILEIVRLVQAGRQSEIYRIYTPPDKLDLGHYNEMLQQEDQSATRAIQDQKLQTVLQQRKDVDLQFWETLEKQTPNFNAAGDEATYMYTQSKPNGGNFKPVLKVFIKIDGKWYFKPVDQN